MIDGPGEASNCISDVVGGAKSICLENCEIVWRSRLDGSLGRINEDGERLALR